MNLKYLSTVTVAMAFSACSLAVYSNEMNNNAARQSRMAQQPASDYWQAPSWPNFNSRASEQARPPARNNNDQNNNYRSHPRSAASLNTKQLNARQPNTRQANDRPQNNRAANDRPPNYQPSNKRRPYQSNNYPVRSNNRQLMNQPDRGRASRPPQNVYRGNPPQQGPYSAPNMPQQQMNQYRQDNAPPAYYNPDYRSHRSINGWNPNVRANRFRGNSAPNPWMNPNKGNMGQGWNDMTNGPGRMGEMPGGWRAPEVSLPNPVDMGDRAQGNVRDLPEKMRNMDVNNRPGQ